MSLPVNILDKAPGWEPRDVIPLALLLVLLVNELSGPSRIFCFENSCVLIANAAAAIAAACSISGESLS